MDEAEIINEIDCPYCAEKINAKAKKCKHCGEFLDSTLRELELMKSSRSEVIITNHPRGTMRTKTAACLWALLLGGLGAHKFYLGRPGWGIVYLLLCWTFVPAIISFFEAICFAVMNQAEFDKKYNA